MNTQTNAQAPAALDPSFGEDGTVDVRSLLPRGVEILGIGAILRLPDNGLIIAAELLTATALNTPGLIKLDSKGQLDTDFGQGNGYLVEHYTDPTPAYPHALHLLSDGRLLSMTNYLDVSTAEFIASLAIYSANGELDQSFAGGRAMVNWLPMAARVAPLPTHKSESEPRSTPRTYGSVGRPPINETAQGSFLFCYEQIDRTYLVQVTALGNADTDFNGTGWTEISHNGTPFQINSVTAHQGKWLVAGHLNHKAALARLHTTAEVDVSFNGNGFRVIEDRGQSEFQTAFVSAGHKIRAGGSRRTSTSADGEAILLGFNAEGLDDPDFQNSFKVLGIRSSLQLTELSSTPTDNLLWSNVEWRYDTCAGYVNEALLARFNPNGVPDSQFGDSGYWRVQDFSNIRGIQVQPDLKCVIAGHRDEWQEGQHTTYCLVRRYLA